MPRRRRSSPNEFCPIGSARWTYQVHERDHGRRQRRRWPSASSTVRWTRSRRRWAGTRWDLRRRAEQHQADGRGQVRAASAVPTTRCRWKCARCAWPGDALAEGSAAQAWRKSMAARLANELLEASEGRGGAMKKRDEVHPHGGGQQGLLALPLSKPPKPELNARRSYGFGHQPGATPVFGDLIPWPARPHRALPQHRHLRAHRCRQDHDDRAHPVLHRCEPQDR